MSSPTFHDLADRLHSVAIHLLRRVRRSDDASELAAAELSALSVIVFGGPITLGDLAQAEQVQPPTITRIAASLAAADLIIRERDPVDARITRVRATEAGVKLLKSARRRRVATLAAAVRALSATEREILARALPVLERIAKGES